jgi:hypothetical protein
MAVANIDDAIRFTPTNVYGQADLGAALDSWVAIFGPTLPTSGPPYYPFDEQSEDQRTCRNWWIPSRRVRGELPSSGWLEPDYEKVIDLVSDTLFAVKYARINGRITQDQEDAVVDQYNIAWP